MTNDNISQFKKRASQLLFRLQNDSSESRKIIAYLRRSPIELSEAPDVWAFIYRGVEGENLLSDKENQALYSALRFYALHKRKNDRPHRYKSEGGEDVSKFLALYSKTPGGANIDSKFSAILLASNLPRALRLLEPLFVRSIGNVKTPIDYVEFALQLHFLQYPASSRKVLLDWAKNYYTNTSIKNEETK